MSTKEPGIGPDSDDAVENNIVSLGQRESKKKKKISFSTLSNKLSIGRSSEEFSEPGQGSLLREGDF